MTFTLAELLAEINRLATDDSVPMKQPDTFSGRPSDVENFIYQVDNYIDMKSKRFTVE